MDALYTNSKTPPGMWYQWEWESTVDNSSDSTEASFQASCASPSSVGPSAIIARQDNGHVGFWQC